MLTSEVKEKGKGKSPEFPCLMQHPKTEVIVLFVDYEEGTVVNVGNDDEDSLGDSSCYWDIREFKPFYGTVVLKSS